MTATTSSGITQYDWSICDDGFYGSFGGKISVLMKSKNKRELGTRLLKYSE